MSYKIVRVNGGTKKRLDTITTASYASYCPTGSTKRSRPQ